MSEPARPAAADAPAADIVTLLFGFRGRIGCGPYWIGIAAVLGLLFLTMFFLAMAMNPIGGGGGEVLALPALLAALWVHAAVSIKRLRDMDLPAWLYAGLVVLFFADVFLGVEMMEVTGGLSLLLIVLALAIPGLAQQAGGRRRAGPMRLRAH